MALAGSVVTPIVGGGLMKERLTALYRPTHARMALGLASLGIALTLATAGTGRTQNEVPAVPLGLEPIPWPQDNPYSPEKAELGRLLYFDKRLSVDQTVACASCHHP